MTTALIKTHHNRCEEIRALIEKGRVIEPLSQFYKDEVREIGEELGLDHRLTGRWPFPGPGLAIRCLGWDEPEQKAATIQLPAELKPSIKRRYTAVEFPIRSVGVQGDGRTYRRVAAVAGPIDYVALKEISNALCNASGKYNRVIVLLAGFADKLANARVVPAQITSKRLELLREADSVMRAVMEEHDLVNSVWQFPTIIAPVTQEGGEVIILRPVNSEDGMTASAAEIDVQILQTLGGKIKALAGVDAVFLDVTTKPPATIEWE